MKRSVSTMKSLNVNQEVETMQEEIMQEASQEVETMQEEVMQEAEIDQEGDGSKTGKWFEEGYASAVNANMPAIRAGNAIMDIIHDGNTGVALKNFLQGDIEPEEIINPETGITVTSYKKTWALHEPIGGKSELTVFEKDINLEIQTAINASKATDGISYVLCRTLYNLNKKEVLDKIGVKTISQFATAFLGLSSGTINQYVRIGKYFIGENYLPVDGLPSNLPVSSMLELLIVNDGQQKGEVNLPMIKFLYATGVFRDGMSSKTIRDAYKNYRESQKEKALKAKAAELNLEAPETPVQNPVEDAKETAPAQKPKDKVQAAAPAEKSDKAATPERGKAKPKDNNANYVNKGVATVLNAVTTAAKILGDARMQATREDLITVEEILKHFDAIYELAQTLVK